MQSDLNNWLSRNVETPTRMSATLWSVLLKHLSQMWIRFFFKRITNFQILWIRWNWMIPDCFWHFSGAIRMISSSQKRPGSIRSRYSCEKHDFSVPNHWHSQCGSKTWLGPDLVGKSMDLSSQTELSGQSVVKFNRNHLETSFLSLQVRSWAFWRV